MAEAFSPTGMYAHYGRKYKSAGIVHLSMHAGSLPDQDEEGR